MSEIFLDVETQRLQSEVAGGWDNIAGFGLSLAVTWDDVAGFRTWLEPDAAAVLLHDAVAGAQPQSRALAHNLGGVEGVEDHPHLVFGDPRPIIGHDRPGMRPAIARALRACARYGHAASRRRR